jgi:hypothetical protein
MMSQPMGHPLWLAGLLVFIDAGRVVVQCCIGPAASSRHRLTKPKLAQRASDTGCRAAACGDTEMGQGCWRGSLACWVYLVLAARSGPLRLLR